MQLIDDSKFPTRECTCHKAGPQAWLCLVDYLVPGISDNLNIRKELIRVVRDEHEADEFNTNTLFWKSLEHKLVESAERNFLQLYDYMTDRSPRMYVNSPLNLLPKFMSVMMRTFNWDIVCDDYYFIFLTQKNTFIKHGHGEVFVRFSVSSKHSRHLMHHINPFLDMMVAVDVNSVFQKLDGEPDMSDPDDNWERVTETRNVRLPQPRENFDESTSEAIPGGKTENEVKYYYTIENSSHMKTKKVIYVRPMSSIPITDPMAQLSPTERILYQKDILTKRDFRAGEQKPSYIVITTFSSPANQLRRTIKRSPPPPFPSDYYL